MSWEPVDGEVPRAEGRSAFGADPANYDRTRPPYPARVYEILEERCGLEMGSRCFEVGAGTGTATRELLARGASVVAIEPDPRLANFLRSAAGRLDDRLTVLEDSFEEAALPPGIFGLGVAATSFHWIEQTRGLRKVHDLLRPGGWWAMWNTVYGDALGHDAFHEATGALMQERTGVGPTAPGGRPVFPLDTEQRLLDLREAAFVDSDHEVIRWVHSASASDVRALYATFSGVTRLPPADREHLLDEIERVAREQFGGVVHRTVLTVIYTARKPQASDSPSPAKSGEGPGGEGATRRAYRLTRPRTTRRWRASSHGSGKRALRATAPQFPPLLRTWLCNVDRRPSESLQCHRRRPRRIAALVNGTRDALLIARLAR